VRACVLQCCSRVCFPHPSWAGPLASRIMADHPSIVEVFSNSTHSWSVGLVVSSKDNKFMVRFLDPEGVARQKVASRSDPQFARFGEHTQRALPPTFLEVPSNSRPGQYSFFDPVAKRKVGSIELAWKVFLERRLLDDQLEASGGIPTTYGTGPGTPRAAAGRSAAYTYPGYAERHSDAATAKEVSATPSAWTAPAEGLSSPQFAVAEQRDGHPHVTLRRAAPRGEVMWEIPNGTMVRLLGPIAAEHVEVSVQQDQRMLRGWVKRRNLQVLGFEFQAEAPGYFATSPGINGNGYHADNADYGVASAYPSYAEMSSKMPTAQAAEPKPSLLHSSLRPESGIFGYGAETIPKSISPVGLGDQVWDRQNSWQIGASRPAPWEAGEPDVRPPRQTPIVEPMMTSYECEAPKPAQPVTKFKKDEKSQIFEPVISEFMMNKALQPVGLASQKQKDSAGNPEVTFSSSQATLSSYDQVQAVERQEVHLPSQSQEVQLPFQSPYVIERQSTEYLEVQPSSPSQHASQRHTVDAGSQEVQRSSSSTTPSASLSAPAQPAAHEQTKQEKAPLSAGPRRSSVDDWVASYMHMPVEKTPGLMYFNRIPVNYTKFVELLMPVAYVNEQHRPRIIQEIQRGAVMDTSLELFTRSHVDMEGNLHWQDGGITNFVTWVFHAHNIGAPTEDLIQPLFEVLDVEKNGYLSVWEGLCLVDALMRATFMKEFVMPEPPPDEADA